MLQCSTGRVVVEGAYVERSARDSSTRLYAPSLSLVHRHQAVEPLFQWMPKRMPQSKPEDASVLPACVSQCKGEELDLLTSHSGGWGMVPVKWLWVLDLGFLGPSWSTDFSQKSASVGKAELLAWETTQVTSRMPEAEQNQGQGGWAKVWTFNRDALWKKIKNE